jgi:hypothetical protein
MTWRCPLKKPLRLAKDNLFCNGRELGGRRQEAGGRLQEPAKKVQEWVVGQKAHQFVLALYRLMRSFPKSATYGLSSQFRRAAVSMAANIAEELKSGETRTISGFQISRKDLLRNRATTGFSLGISSTAPMTSNSVRCFPRSASCLRLIPKSF